jgi:multiple sugar transport system substrate-binding protein
MKYIFVVCFLVLFAAGSGLVLTEPDLRSDVPVLYWVTDSNPARIQQVEGFHRWLIEQGHVTEDGRPVVELRLDTASRDGSKQLIQSVAGVAGDILDCDIRQMHSLGVLADVTEPAETLGFGVAETYPPLAPVLTIDGRQYGFPCNVAILSFWSKPATFEAVGLSPPGRDWSIEEFEQLGREFVRRANPPGQRQTVFFCNSLATWQGRRMMMAMHRSRGLSVFNETMTAATTDDPRYVWTLAKVRQWTYEDHLMPTAAEESSFASEAGYGGAELPMFVGGRYAMILSGRWNVIRLRDYPDPPVIRLSYFPTPEGGWPNDVIAARSAAVYAGSEHPERATLFLAYLASENYNRLVVDDGDALPPNPAFANSEAFDRPADHPNEWDIHAPTHHTAMHRAVALAESPFIASGTTRRLAAQAVEKVMATPMLATPEQAAATLQAQINHEIRVTVNESDTLRRRYEQQMKVQENIEARRAEGRPVPLAWITNPFHRRYYVEMGWAEVDASSEGAS